MKNSIGNILTTFGVVLLNLMVWSASAATTTNVPEKYTVTYFTAKNGIEDGLVNDMLQDNKGLLWFATWNGLYRFDGYGFQNYKSNAEDRGRTNE